MYLRKLHSSNAESCMRQRKLIWPNKIASQALSHQDSTTLASPPSCYLSAKLRIAKTISISLLKPTLPFLNPNLLSTNSTNLSRSRSLLQLLNERVQRALLPLRFARHAAVGAVLHKSRQVEFLRGVDCERAEVDALHCACYFVGDLCYLLGTSVWTSVGYSGVCGFDVLVATFCGTAVLGVRCLDVGLLLWLKLESPQPTCYFYVRQRAGCRSFMQI